MYTMTHTHTHTIKESSKASLGVRLAVCCGLILSAYLVGVLMAHLGVTLAPLAS